MSFEMVRAKSVSSLGLRKPVIFLQRPKPNYEEMNLINSGCAIMRRMLLDPVQNHHLLV